MTKGPAEGTPPIGALVIVADIADDELRSWRAAAQLADVLVHHPHLLTGSPATAALRQGQRFRVESIVSSLPWMKPEDGPWVLGRFSAGGLDWHTIARWSELKIVTPSG